ncbi:carbon storage regulator CsrA [Spirochaetota bacterium]
MLVLARKKNQSIIIGNDIRLYVIDISSDQVKLGIEAPKNIPVHRQEIYEEIQQQNILASKSDVSSLEKLKNLKFKEKND